MNNEATPPTLDLDHLHALWLAATESYAILQTEYEMDTPRTVALWGDVSAFNRAIRVTMPALLARVRELEAENRKAGTQAETLRRIVVEAEKNTGSAWIPVTERLPEEGQAVLAYDPAWCDACDGYGNELAPHACPTGRLAVNTCWQNELGHRDSWAWGEPTHWQPLPPPPHAHA